MNEVKKDTMLENHKLYQVILNEKEAVNLMIGLVGVSLTHNAKKLAICYYVIEGDSPHCVDIGYYLPNGNTRDVARVILEELEDSCLIIIKDFANRQFQEILNNNKIKFTDIT